MLDKNLPTTHQSLPATPKRVKPRSPLLIMLFKQRRRAFMAFLVSLAAAILGAILEPPLHEATASLLFNLDNERRYAADTSNENGVPRTLRTSEVINTELEILNSRDLKEEVLNAMTLDQVYPEVLDVESGRLTPMERAILKFERALTVRSVKDSFVVHLGFTHEDPVIAQSVLDIFIKRFIDKKLKLYGGSQTKFFEDRLAEYSRDLNEAGRVLQDFKQKHGVVNVDEQIRLLLQRQSQVEDQFRQAKAKVEELVQKVAALEELKSKMPKSQPMGEDGSNSKGFAEQRLLELQLKEQEMLRKYNDNSRLVQEVRKDMEGVKSYLKRQDKQFADRAGATPNKMYWDLQMEITRNKSELVAAQRSMREAEVQRQTVREDLRALDVSKRDLRALEDRLAVKENQYKAYLGKLEEAKISETLDAKKITNVGIFQKPAISPHAVRTSKIAKVLLGALLGILAGYCVAYFSEARRRVFYTPESVEDRLGLPVLATISASN